MPNQRRRLVGLARHGVPLAVVAALLVPVATTATVGAMAHSATAASKSKTLHIAPLDAIRRLTVAKHSHLASYDRKKDFGHWIRQGRGCTTARRRAQAGVARAHHPERRLRRPDRPVVEYFNARYYTQADALQIDHTVGVENAWVSGAWRWTHVARVRYYNDLGDTRTLVAVDRDDNLAKGEQDPTTWVPKRGHCSFVRHWITVKTRWHLSVIAAEKTTLRKLAHGCDARSLTIRLATIRYR